VGHFVVENFLRPAEEEHEGDSHHNDHRGGLGDFTAEGLAQFMPGGASYAAPDSQASPRPLDVRTATSVDRALQHAKALDRLAARELDHRVHDQAFAALDDSGLADPLRGDVFTWAK
jgi:hypothetical protein